MANSAPRPQRAYHQDYICRIRYENNLPPPPGSVKLLDIPIDGLDYYASPGFASRLHRSQPINIEADAELGMPIDLVGMPGVFDGDESSIQAPLIPPPVHPRDKNLLRPLSELGKPKYQPGGISFLRRTEYISSDVARARSEAASKSAPKSAGPKLRKTVDTSKDDPINVLRAAVKGFDIAHPEDAYTGPDTEDNIKGLAPTPAEIEAWNNPKHPTKSNLKSVDYYPILPDLEAGTDTGSYMIAKFTANPTQVIEKHDPRMDVGMLRPIEMDDVVTAGYNAKLAAHGADPMHNPHPGGAPFNYHFFLPTDETSASNLREKLDVQNPDKDNPNLYTTKNKDGRDVFRMNQQRVYETGRSTAADPDHAYKEVALALHDTEIEQADYSEPARFTNGESTKRLEKAAYYYPVMQKMQLKPHRSKTLAQLGVTSRVEDDDDDRKIDALEVVVDDLNETERAKRAEHRVALVGEVGDEEATQPGDV
ncbi:MAG: hypothetical protein L6R41_001436 [Letrouitia leprolyta]|nr:MAG: hypothetical protein L6R41_001436 [Letrouitia leprolyta]